MAAASPKPQGLRELLDGMVKSQKKDIHAYSGGHLNEANLYRDPNVTPYKTWRSSKKPPLNLNPPSRIPRPLRDKDNDEFMKGTLVNFSVGTAGNLPATKTMRKPPKGTRGPVTFSPTKTSVRNDSPDSVDSYAKQDDGVLVEDLKLPGLMLSTAGLVHPRPKGWMEEDFRIDQPLQMPSQSRIKEENLNWLQHKFVPCHLEEVTKKDQFLKMKSFESNVLRKQDALELNVLSGVSAVEHLERGLQQDLDALQYNGYGPNFHRLQIYSNTFDNLVQETPTFGYILKTIKKEYDDYIATLLDGQTAKHQVLYDQVDQLSSRTNYDPRKLTNEAHKVQGLEREAKVLLELNERLRRELGEEIELASLPEPEQPKKHQVYKEEPPLELVDQVEELHATILEKLDQMNSLKHRLRTDYVPSSVCTHLEQCIKETEVDIQKLTSQKEYFERSIVEMEAELQEAIDSADTTERDARRIWKRIEAVTSQTTTGKQKQGAGLNFFDSDDEDDEQKWNWYIS